MSPAVEQSKDTSSPTCLQEFGADNGDGAGRNVDALEKLQGDSQQQGGQLSMIQAGLQRKASPLVLNSWTTLSLTLDGRDKITKFLQYLARLLVHYYSHGGNRDNDDSRRRRAASWQALYTSLSFSRKAFRLGRSVVEIEKLFKLARLWGVLMLSGRTRTSQPPNGQVDNDLQVWKIFGTALKTIGLCGFWAADGFSFLSSIGCLDNDPRSGVILDNDQLIHQRKVYQQQWAMRANRSYFFGSLAGLYVTFKTFLIHQQNQVAAAYEMYRDAKTSAQMKDASQYLNQVKEKQFLLLLDLIKSCCDVLVFSNNPGVDLWAKYRGCKLDESFHCLGGMISASVVLYNNYPNVGTNKG